jgi:hypothetical protein
MPLVSCVSNDALNNSLSPLSLSFFKRKLADFHEEIVDSTVVCYLFDVLNEVNF